MVRWLVRNDRLWCFSFYTLTVGAAAVGLGLFERLTGAGIGGILSWMFQ
jgi:hypothetical protein